MPRTVDRRCSFSTISVREYDQTLGDSLSCQEGPPIMLDWDYAEQKEVSIDKFENTRKNQRRRRSELVLGAAERRKVLVMNGSTLMEIVHAERLVALKNGVSSMATRMNFQGQKIKTPSVKKCTNGPRKAMVSRAA